MSFLSKLRVVQVRLQAFIDSNNLMPVTQSAYRQYHSTETTVTKLYNDMLLAADSGQLIALCLRDLTAAFNTVDHDLLLLCFERQFGLQGVVVQWFRLYLAGRSFHVLYCNQTSYAVYIVCSMPLGSVFYMTDLADEVQEHQVNMHTYADDTQLYLHCRHYDNAAAVTRLETCLNGVSHWMAADRLKLNVEKTELLWAGSRFSAEAQLGSIGPSVHRYIGTGPSVQFGTETVPTSDHVRVLGVTFSSDLSLDKYVASVVFAHRAFIDCVNYDVSDDP